MEKKTLLMPDGDFALVFFFTLAHRDDGGTGIPRVNDAEGSDRGDAEIRGRVTCQFFQGGDAQSERFSGFQCGSLDIQTISGTDIWLVLKTKPGIGINEPAEHKEDEKAQTDFFHIQTLFFIIYMKSWLKGNNVPCYRSK